jgi:hypothetical protein
VASSDGVGGVREQSHPVPLRLKRSLYLGS